MTSLTFRIYHFEFVATKGATSEHCTSNISARSKAEAKEKLIRMLQSMKWTLETITFLDIQR